MSIKYALVPNHLTDDPKNQRAIVQQSGKTTEDVIDYILREGSPMTRAEVLAVIEEYEAGITKFLAEGYRVNTSLMQISASISGIFNGIEDSFDPKRHRVNLNLHAGSRLKNTLEDISTEKVRARKRYPTLLKMKDYASETDNDRLSPGGSGEIMGSLLKFDPEDSAQGIFFITADGTETKVTSVMLNTPSKLLFIVPRNLSAGTYKLEVRTIVRHTTSIRKGKLPVPLTVS